MVNLIAGQPPAPERRALVLASSLRREVHWIRTFYAANEGQRLGSEVLLDNETWEDAERRFAERSWPAIDGIFGVRLFMMLVPNDDAAERGARPRESPERL